MDDCLCDCGDCGCGDCDCCDCGTGFLLGCCAADCCETNSRKNMKSNDDGCCLFFVILTLVIFACYFIFKSSKKDVTKEELTIYKIVEVQGEWRIFGQDGNTILEDVKTGERKTVIGKRGKVGEEIKLKE